MARMRVEVTQRQVVQVFATRGWRMNWMVDGATARGVTLSVEASHPSWWGGPSGLNRLTTHACEFGQEVVFRTRASSLLPLPRTVRVTPDAAPDGRVGLTLELPLGWTVELDDVPDDDFE